MSDINLVINQEIFQDLEKEFMLSDRAKQKYVVSDLIDENPFPTMPKIKVIDLKQGFYTEIELSVFEEHVEPKLAIGTLNGDVRKDIEISDLGDTITFDNVFNVILILFWAVSDRMCNIYESENVKIEYLDRSPKKTVKRNYNLRGRVLHISPRSYSIDKTKK